jgi:hypothetical protein
MGVLERGTYFLKEHDDEPVGDTPGCVKWLAEHPDPSKDQVE